MRLMEGEHVGPFNLGNPGEFTMLELAQVSVSVLYGIPILIFMLLILLLLVFLPFYFIESMTLYLHYLEWSYKQTSSQVT